MPATRWTCWRAVAPEAPDQPLLQHLAERGEAGLAHAVQDDLAVAQLDRAVGALEVEAGGDLAPGLVDRVAHLLHVELGDDVEGRHGRRG